MVPAAANSAFQALNNLTAEFATGARVEDSALTFVSQQRVQLDNSRTPLSAASDTAPSGKTQLTACQTELMLADLPGSLFDKL